ncbi:MAG TPA: ABC transporter permease [Anaerolineales bacterium]|nr:ABC transporter permease [Anaerolineales bacterium]
MKVIDIALKDLLRSFRSLFAVGMMFVAPLLITGIIYFAFGGLRGGDGAPDLPVTNVVVVNLDEPLADGQNLGALLVEFLKDEQLAELITATEMNDEASARAAIDRQEAGVVVIIPTDFSAAVAAPDGRATLTLIHDPTLTLGPSIVRDIISQFADAFSGVKIALNVAGDQLADRGVESDPTMQMTVARRYAAWAAESGGEAASGTIPGLNVQSPGAASSDDDPIAEIMAGIMAGMLIFFSFYGGAYTAQSILREDEEGTLARLFTTPTPRAVILGGKFVSVFITVAVQAVVLMTASALAFGVRWGQPIPVTLMVVGLVVVATGLGLFLVSFVKTTRQSGPVIGGVLTMTSMVGGLFSTGVRMPAAFDTITLFMPQGWALRGWRLAQEGAGAGDVLLPFAVMAALGVLFFALGAMNFRKRFA